MSSDVLQSVSELPMKFLFVISFVGVFVVLADIPGVAFVGIPDVAEVACVDSY